MDAAVQKLTEASHKLAEHMYQQASPEAGTEGAAAAPEQEGEEVIDAEYVDVDASKE